MQHLNIGVTCSNTSRSAGYSFSGLHRNRCLNYGIFLGYNTLYCRSQRPRVLRRKSAAARPAEIVGSNPTGGMDVCCEFCVFSSRGLCDELITRPEESYGLWCVAVCDLETSRMRRPWPALGCSVTEKKKPYIIGMFRRFGRRYCLHILGDSLVQMGPWSAGFIYSSLLFLGGVKTTQKDHYVRRYISPLFLPLC
jgi:hypothetical protein